ncbi:MAG: alpha/beta hydrolase [Clostridia bacterium]|nr:alpha/beta hydrolase [Clostridia bacterium]
MNNTHNALPDVQLAPDADPEQYLKDMARKDNVLSVDDRFVLRDGQRHPFAVICPGGGYGIVCSFIEGVPYARRLNEKGISAFIVYYRVGEEARYPHPQEDLGQAVKAILSKKDEYMLDAEHFSVWGSSAGGHLAASFGTDNMGYLSRKLPKPEAIVLAYPVVSMAREISEKGTHGNLLGEHPTREMEEETSVERHVTKDFPPTFIFCGLSDQAVKPENTHRLLAALRASDVPCDSFLVPGVDHGVGPATGTPAEGWIDGAVDFWMKQRAQP